MHKVFNSNYIKQTMQEGGLHLKTHLYALLVIIGHDSDTLMSDADIGGDAILHHRIIALNNLEEKHVVHSVSLNVCPTHTFHLVSREFHETGVANYF